MFEEEALYAGPALALEDFEIGGDAASRAVETRAAVRSPGKAQRGEATEPRMTGRHMPKWLLMVPGLLIGGGCGYAAAGADAMSLLALSPASIEASVEPQIIPVLPASARPHRHRHRHH